MTKVIVGITGASGAPYAKRLLEVLDRRCKQRGDLEVAVCISNTASEVWSLECGGDIREALPFPIWDLQNYRAPFASGSAGWHAMVIVPCSMGTVARIAHGISDTLLTRTADVMLKERRKLIVVPRETPLSLIHLENLTALARAGADVIPAMPAFYSKPKTLDDLVSTVVARVVDHLGLVESIAPRWGES